MFYNDGVSVQCVIYGENNRDQLNCKCFIFENKKIRILYATNCRLNVNIFLGHTIAR